jgi:hypothetical protein
LEASQAKIKLFLIKNGKISLEKYEPNKTQTSEYTAAVCNPNHDSSAAAIKYLRGKI